MHFNLIVPAWVLPFLLTMLTWIVVVLWPTQRDSFGMGDFFTGVVKAFFALVWPLVYWTVFFAWIAFRK